MAQYVFSMRKVRKAHGDKVVLDDVTLAFLPGAKIGVVGPNGAGKSSVLRIMAGLDHASNGDAVLSRGYSVGMLEQEPKLDETKDVRGNVEDGVAATRQLLHRYDEISERLGSADGDEMERLLAEMGSLQEKLGHAGAWDLDNQLEMAMDALRLPPGDADAAVLSGGERRRRRAEAEAHPSPSRAGCPSPRRRRGRASPAGCPSPPAAVPSRRRPPNPAAR